MGLWFLCLLCCAHGAKALRTVQPYRIVPPDCRNVSGKDNGVLEHRSGLRHPTLVIGGISGSGTTAVIKALEHLGLGHCSNRDAYAEPPWAHACWPFDRYEIINQLLNMSDHQMTETAYRRNRRWFRMAVEWLHRVAEIEVDCLEKDRMAGEATGTLAGLRWGFKEAHYAWLLPVMNVAYENHTNYLIIARDPRDICNANTRDQFDNYGKGDCYKWWADFWTALLDAFEDEARLRVLRIEDLVVPDPSNEGSSMKVLQCMLDHAGLKADMVLMRAVLEELCGAVATSLAASRQPQPSAEDAMHDLRDFHDHRSQYSGNKFSDEFQQEQDAELANRTEIHSIMQRLGYNLTHWGLMTPQSSSVCRH